MQKLSESQRIRKIEQKWQSDIKKLFYNWHWEENLKHSEIAEKIEVPRPTITRWFNQLGIPTQSCTRFTNLNLEKHREWLRANKKVKIKKEFPWHFDKNFFNEWTKRMAYVLGFLTADGCVFTNQRGSKFFEFDSTDQEIIEKIKTVLNSNHKVGIRKAKNLKWKDKYVLQIGSKDVVECLKKYGIVQNKSLIIEFPKDIPNEFLKHFVRGYFDGDGGVYFKQHWRKNRNKFGWVFQTYFISGSKKFLEGLHKALKVCTIGGFINQKKRGYALVFSRKDGFSLFDFMYKDVPEEMFLKRKYNVFAKAKENLMGP